MLSWYCEQNDKYDQVKEGKKNKKPHDVVEISLEFPLASRYIPTRRVSSRRASGRHKTHSNAQSCRRLYGRVVDFHNQRLIARFAENPFLARLRRTNRLFERDRTRPDQSQTNRAAFRLVPTPSPFCFSPGGDRYIISWKHMLTHCPFGAHCQITIAEIP